MAVNPILVALDVPGEEEALGLARALLPVVGGFKVGLELLMGHGPRLVNRVVELGLPVFCDAKLHDIPTTVQRAAEQLAQTGARWITVHASGGREQLQAAVEGFGSGGVLAVTMLTSMDAAGLLEVGVSASPGDQVVTLAALAEAAGVEGVICSPREVQAVAVRAPSLLKVTPGIRPSWAASNDQRRVATPSEAIARGSDRLVIGRPITAADDPVEAAARILQELPVPGDAGIRDGL